MMTIDDDDAFWITVAHLVKRIERFDLCPSRASRGLKWRESNQQPEANVVPVDGDGHAGVVRDPPAMAIAPRKGPARKLVRSLEFCQQCLNAGEDPWTLRDGDGSDIGEDQRCGGPGCDASASREPAMERDHAEPDVDDEAGNLGQDPRP